MIRLGAVGGGMVFNRYFAVAHRVGEIQITSLAETDLARAAYWHRQGCRVEGIDELLDDDLDAVMVLTPNATHGVLVKRCIERGIHVLCEKPLALSAGEAQDLFDLAASRDVILYPAMHVRHRPEIRYLLERCANSVARIEQVWLEDWRQGPRWYRDSELSGGGVLLDVGVNHIDWMLSLIGDLTPGDATSTVAESGVEEECAVTWHFATGFGRSELSWRTSPQRRRSVIRKTDGSTLVADHDARSIDDNGKSRGPWNDDEYEAVLSDFKSVLNRTRPVDADRTVRSLELIEEAYRLTGQSFFQCRGEGTTS